MLLKRILRRSKRAVQEFADIKTRRTLAATPRGPRAATPVDDLAAHAILVVVAHPDDEIIAAGALMGRAAKVGVICLTNGAPRKESYARQAGFDNWLNYAFARRAEAEAALALLDREVAPSRSLGITDQDTVNDLVAVTRHLVAPLSAGFSHVVTHAYEGGHPDHDSTAFCVHAACALIERAGGGAPVIVEAPLYSAPQGAYIHSQFLPHDDAGPITTFPLTPREQALKRRMFDCHLTQRKTFDDFGVEEESFRLAPRYHFAAPPHAGAVGYDQFNWPVNGRVWRNQAWKAIRELGVPELA